MYPSICFIFPHPASGPTGGYKVVYEYANRFAADGYRVHIVYSGSIYWRRKPLRYKLTNCVRFVQQMIKGYSCRGWFPLDKRVKEHYTLSMCYRHVPKADVYVATSPYTAYYLDQYPVDSKRKFYFIQGKEDWGPGIKAILEDTYHAKLQKIAVSGWLQSMLKEEYQENSALIANGFDFEKFSLDIQPKLRKADSTSFLYSSQTLKRCEDIMDALNIVKKKYPSLKVTAFGVPARPNSMPDWYDYYQMPDAETHNRINNEAAIYVAASETEGWGLTVGEAMICGQAVCCTDNDGYKEMARHGETALLSPVCNPEALAANIILLIEDDSLRLSVALKGHEFIQRFRWEDSYAKFKMLIDNV